MEWFTEEEKKLIANYRKEHGCGVYEAQIAMLRFRERQMREREVAALERIAEALEGVERAFHMERASR